MPIESERNEARAQAEREYKLRRAQAERANDHDAIAEAERVYEETRANIDEHFARIKAAEAEQRALMAGDRFERPIVAGEPPPPPRPDLLSRRATKALRDRDELQARLAATRAEEFEAVQEIDRTREAEIASAAELARKGEPIPAEFEVEKVERRAAKLAADREALERAVESATRDYLAVLAEDREAMIEKAEDEARSAREGARQAARSLMSALGALDAAESSRVYAENVSRGVQPRIKPTAIRTALRNESREPIEARWAAAAIDAALAEAFAEPS
jgi:hypothetical protein